jgi:hypothetical protein
MYTGVNDIMRLERGPGSSLDGELLVACPKALTTDQFSAELATPPASCGAICMDQAARTTLLAAMPTLDDVDIAVVQRGDLSRGVMIPGATVTGKGKGVSTRVVLDDVEVLSDEDEPLQVRLRSLFPAGGSTSLGTILPIAVAAEAAGAEAATYRRAAEEAAATEVPGEGSSVPGQVPSSAAGAKWLLSTGQTALQGRLETSVCPKVIAPCFIFFLRDSLLQLSTFQTTTDA